MDAANPIPPGKVTVTAGAAGRLVFGGEMELSPAVMARAAAAAPVRPPAGAISVCTGRTGLRLAIRACPGQAPGAPVLFPAYLCPSLLQAAREEGVPTAFYRLGENLTLDAGALLEAVALYRPRAVVIIDFFGFPPEARTIAPLLERCRQTCPVIEDAVQGSWVELSPPAAGGLGDYVLTSFRKYLPLPDGGWLWARANRGLPEGLVPLADAFVQNRLAGKIRRSEVLRDTAGSGPEDAAYLELFARAERELDTAIPLAAMSEGSARLLAVQDLGAAGQRRRANFASLLAAFDTHPVLQSLARPLYRHLPAGVSPLAFPVRLNAPERRDAFRAALRGRDVFCPVHWSLPPELSAGQFPAAAALSQAILSIPLDQRYTPADMEELAARLAASWRALA